MGGEQSGNSIDIDYITESIDLEDKDIDTFTIQSCFAGEVKYLNLANNHISSLPDFMSKIVSINLSKNKLGPLLPNQIVEQIMTYKKLRTLNLSSNLLDGLNIFLRNKSLESLHLTQNRFKSIPNDFFERFLRLKLLYLDCNFIETLSNLKSEKLIGLSLALNNISSLDPSTFSFPQLKSLNLSKNKIEKIPEDFSKSFPKLSVLNINFNLITEISENEVFPQVLTDLKITNNLIEKVPHSITSLSLLTSLNIRKNKLKFLPKMPASIVHLDVSHNLIEKVEKQTLPNLKEFNANHNMQTTFPSELKMEKVESFIIHHNKITVFDITSLSSSLSTLDISFNQIEKIPANFFNELPNLRVFLANFNKIDEIPAQIANCRCLDELAVSFNPLGNLPKLPRSLKKLSASNCKLSSFNSDGFVDDEESPIVLTHVDLSGNRLETFPEFESIQFLNVSQNSLKKLPKITEKVVSLDASMNEIDSLSVELRGASLVDLNLSFNRIEKLPSFEFLPSLKYIDVSNNPIDGALDVSANKDVLRVDIANTKRCEVVCENGLCNFDVITSNPLIEKKVTQPMRDPILIVQKEGEVKSGYSEIVGLRKTMEDSVIVRDDLRIYAICDGHGGFDTSKFASIHLPSMFEAVKDQITFEKAGDIILDIYKEIEEELRELNFDDGSTLCLCLLCEGKSGGEKVVTAHLGDTRALIVRKDGTSRELTKDHKPSIRKEFERIHSKFGMLAFNNRIDGVLAVSRSIGDYSVFAVGREIELNGFGVNEDDRYLVICCDGVFDVLTNDDVAVVASGASSPSEAAFSIRNAAYACGSTDNISVVVVDLTVKEK